MRIDIDAADRGEQIAPPVTQPVALPQATPAPAEPRVTMATRARAAVGPNVRDIDFRGGPQGEGRALIRLPTAETRVTMREQGSRILVDIVEASLPQRLFRRLDVTDFGTPVTAIESRPKGRNVEVEIQTTGEFEYMAYQTDELLTIELRPLTALEKEQRLRDKVIYDGERLSLNFQDIEVRAVLQLLADFTDLNLIASDAVGGNITLRLKNVPWDQALDIILRTKNLAKRQEGNVIMVGPFDEIVGHEERTLSADQKREELAPLRSEFIQVNYAKAADLANLLKSEYNQLLTKDRGNVAVDNRTNTLLVQDTLARLEDIRSIVTRLDVPVQQVMIESRVVIANNDFARDLGVRLGLGASTGQLYGNELLIGGGLPGNLTGFGNFDAGPFGLDTDGESINSIIRNPLTAPSVLVNLPVRDPSGAVNFLIGKVGSHLLQLELSAMQREGQGEIISSPRVITSDQTKATVQLGEQIPYQTVEGTGDNRTASTSFVDALLELDVTPQITPDDKIIMDLKVTKNTANRAQATVDGIPIDKRSIETTVLVANGETLVLGGVYERTKSFAKDQVPWLGDVPVLGRLFKKEERFEKNQELLIFVTPRIIKGDLAGR